MPRTNNKRGDELLVIMGDTHCGSGVGLCPPDFVLTDESVIQHNPARAWVWKNFKKAIEGILDYAAGDPFSIVHMGDAIEGLHHRTTEVFSPRWEDHINCAYESILPLREKANKFYMIRGTECHTQETEENLGKKLGAVPVPGTKRRYAFDRLNLMVNGRLLNATHHMPTSGRPWTSTTALAGCLASARLAAIECGTQPPDIVARAHRHDGVTYFGENGLVIVSHPWQLETRHVHKVVPHAHTTVGIHILDWRGLGHGVLPNVKEIAFRPRPEPILSL